MSETAVVEAVVKLVRDEGQGSRGAGEQG